MTHAETHFEAQKDAIRAYAETHDLNVVRWFEETETAAKSKRPIFNQIIKALRQKKADGLIVHKIDRSSRNICDWGRIHDLADIGVDIHFAHEALDFNTRGGRLAADIQAVVAADFIRNNREESKKGQIGRLKEGLYPYTAPLGYLDNGKAKLKTICPVRGPLVRLMFELYASGEYSYVALTEEMNIRGLTTRTGRKLYVANVELILTNPFYTGIIKIRRTGKVYSGKHEPLISQDLFAAVAALREGRNIKKNTKHNHTYRGLFRCADCGNAMVGELQRGHVYYRCHTRGCVTKCISDRMIDEQVRNILFQYGLSDDAALEIEQRVFQHLEGRSTQSSGEQAELQLKQIRTREMKLTEKFLDDLIDETLFNEMKENLLIQRAKCEETLRQKAEQSIDANKLRQFLERAKSLHLSHVFADPAQKRQITKITTSNRRVSGKTVEIEPQNWLVSLNSNDPSNIVHTIRSQLEHGLWDSHGQF